MVDLQAEVKKKAGKDSVKTMTERLLDEYFAGNAAARADAEARLQNGEPLAYILGETVFFDEYYCVTPDVLIPRPDTERVVEQVLRRLHPGGRLLDLCCGSGCIAISSLCHSKDTTALLVDISAPALEIAKKNAARNGVLDRCAFLCADLRAFSCNEKFDVIASNPPYVRTSVIDTLERECSYEPRIAFDGGGDGMDFYRLLLDLCPPLLSDGGKLVFEIGYDQRADITALCAEKGLALEIYKDYGKNDRVAVIDCKKV